MAVSQVEQQLIQIAAEDGTHAGGATANSDCGRRWHSRYWSNVSSGLQQKTVMSMVEKQLTWIAEKDGTLDG
jgi:hypothetical protein